MAKVALGIKARNGTAVLVAVTAPPVVELVHRDDVELLRDEHPPRPWHVAQAQGLDPAAADALAHAVEDAARRGARRLVDDALAATSRAGHDPVGCAVLGEPVDVPPAADVLRSHSALHVAEDELYFSAVADAASATGLPVVAVRPASVDVAAITVLLADLGRSAGRPWRADHKLAVAAALSLL